MILILKLDCIGYIPAKNYELFKIILKKWFMINQFDKNTLLGCFFFISTFI